MTKTTRPFVAGLLAWSVSIVASAGIYHDDWIDRNKNDIEDPYENPELTVPEGNLFFLERY